MRGAGIRSRRFRIQSGEVSVRGFVWVVEEVSNLFEVVFFYFGFPFPEGTRGYFEPCFRGHVAAAKFRVFEGFRYEVAATLRGFYEVLARLTNREAVISFLSRYEEHLSKFYG